VAHMYPSGGATVTR